MDGFKSLSRSQRIRYPIGRIGNTCVYNIIISFTDPTSLIDIYVIIIIFFYHIILYKYFFFYFFGERSIACFFSKRLPFTHVAVVSSAFPSFDCVYYAYTRSYTNSHTHDCIRRLYVMTICASAFTCARVCVSKTCIG